MPATLESSFGVGVLTMPLTCKMQVALSTPKTCRLRDDGFHPRGHKALMDDIDIRSGNLLRAWRESLKLSQSDLAEKIGTTGSVVHLLESGQRKLSPKWLNKIAPVFGITPGWLLDHHPDDLSADIRDLWGNIPEPRRTLARDVLRTFNAQPPDTGTDG